MHRKFYIMTLSLGVLMAGSFGTCVAAQDFPSERFVLENGLTVLISEIPTSPMVSVYGLVKTGSAREGKFVGSGISHYLEHMLFKGTHGRELGEIASSIQAVGGSINASTGTDFTIYTIDVPYEHIDLALDVLRDMLFAATIDEGEAQKERDVIFAEMRMHRDNPDRYLNELTNRNAYQKHPYRYPVIGYEDLLSSISRDELFEYYKLHYAPNNMILSIAGHVDIETVKAKVQDQFGAMAMSRLVMDVVPVEPQQLDAKEYSTTYPTDITRVTFSHKSVSLLDQDLYALDVLAQVLGQGESSRLYQELYKKKQLVYSVYAGNYTPEDLGLFTISAELETQHLDEVKKIVQSQIELIQAKGVNKKELEKAKRQVLSSYVMNNQKASNVAWHQAMDETMAGDFQFSAKYVEKVKNVTNDDIKKVAQRYLSRDKRVTTVLMPEHANAQSGETSVSSNPGEITQQVLINGLRVLTRIDPSFPLVNIQLVLRGGLLSEPEGQNGIANLTSSLWTKGTGSMSSAQIEELTDSLGMDLSSFSGKNSLGISMNLLSEDIDTAFDLLEKIILDASIPDEEIERKKKDVLNAIKLRDENISNFTMHTLLGALYAKHPYALDVLGSNESVQAITREDMLAYLKRHLTAKNMVLSAFGDIDQGHLMERIQKLAAKLPHNEFTQELPQAKNLIKSETITQFLNKQQAMIAIGFKGVDLFSSDRYALEVVEAILGSSFSGRLFNSIREEFGESYTMGGLSVPGFGTGHILFYVLTDPSAVDNVVAVMQREIKRLQAEAVSDQELLDIKNYLKGMQKADLELNKSLAFQSSLDELYGVGYDDYKAYDGYIERVTKEDVQRIASNYLKLDNAVTVITRPQSE